MKHRIVSGELPPGAALPSQADLMRNYGVALGTVRQVLNRLQSEGWVSSHRGKGSFVRPRGVEWKVGATAAAVGVAAFGEPDVTEYDHLLAMRTALSRENVELMVGVFTPKQIDAALNWARPLSGLMAWARPPHAFLERLISASIPTVLLGNMQEGQCPPQISHVNFNLRAAIDQSVQYLSSLGHRRILFVNRGGRDAQTFPEFLHQLSVLTADVVRHRIPEAVYEELALDGDEVERLLAHLNSTPTPPTALLFEGGQRACRFLHEMEKAGWSAPQRVSVIGISPLKPRQITLPDLSYVELPMVQLATRGSEVMLELLKDRRVVRESISPVLHWGNTCRTVGE
jgi:DNA-binding LacI/PurR family transcriptional regulator